MDSVAVGPIAYTGKAELQQDIDNFKAALRGVSVEEAFLPVAAPASVIPDRKNEYYPSDDDLQQAIAEAMQTEYKTIIDAGFLVQLDDARAAVTLRPRWCRPRASKEYRTWVARQVEVTQPRDQGHRRARRSATTSAGAAGRGPIRPTCRSRTSSTSS